MNRTAPRPRFGFAAIRTLFLVTLISALVWLFAETESLSEAPVSVRILTVDSTGGRRVSVVRPDWSGSARVTVRGATGAVQRISNLGGPVIQAAPGDPGFADDVGEIPIDLKTLIQSHPQFSDIGLRVMSVEPPTLRVRVEEIAELPDVPVRLDLDDVDLARAAVIEPGRVTLSGPRSVIAALQGLEGTSPYVLGRIPPSQLINLEPGAEATFDASLELPIELNEEAREHVRLEPGSVSVTIEIANRRATYDVPAAPVWVRMLPDELERWRVEIHPEDKLLSNIRIVGPADQIELVRSGAQPIVAVIEVTDTDLTAGVASKPIDRWNTPVGVRVESEHGPIRLMIAPREQPAPSEPTG